MSNSFIGAATGNIQDVNDGNWFKITLTANTEYVFDMGNGTLSDPQVGVYDSSGNLLTSANGGGGPNNDSQVIFDPTATGTYFIGASSQAGTNTGTYALQAYTVTPDFSGNINTLGTVSIGGNVSGTLANVNQNDLFKVTLTAGTEYVFNVGSSALGSPLVTLYNSSGKYILSGNDYETLQGNALTFIPSTTGTYFAGVSDTGSTTGAFSLSASTAAFDFGDTITTAGTVAVGGSATGDITTPQQRDWFEVTLTAGTQYTFTVSGNIGGSPLSNPTVALYDANGNTVIAQISGGGSGGAAERSFTPTTSGNYFVEAGAIFGGTGTFTVAVASVTSDNTGTINTAANTLTSGGHVNDTIQVPSDSDWFSVSLIANTEYLFKVTDTTLAGGVVTLYNASGTQLDQQTGSSTAQIAYEPTSSGTYFVGASGQLADTGTYSISESTATPDFLGNIKTAGTITVGSHATGNLASAGQNDWFKVTLTAGTAYLFTISGALTGGEVSVYNSTGTSVVSDATQTTFTPTSTGTYFVGASSNDAGTGTFTVTASSYTNSDIPTINTAGIFTSAASEIASPTATTIADSAADLQAAGVLDGLQALVTSGKLSAVYLTDPTTAEPTITVTAAQTLSDSGLLNDIKSPFTLAIVGQSTATVATFLQDEYSGFQTYVAENSGATANHVLGFTQGTTNFLTGTGVNNAIVLNGLRSEYDISVDGTGKVVIFDTSDNQTMTATNVNQIVFDSDASTLDSYNTSIIFNSVYLINPTESMAQIAEIYKAAFNRTPDVAGLVYWQGEFNAGLSMNQIAGYFTTSSEFEAAFPQAAALAQAGGNTTANQTAYVDALFLNVLNETPSSPGAAAGIAYWVGELAAGVTPAEMLADFALAAQRAVGAFNGAWLIDTATGGYADSSELIAPSSVLSQYNANAQAQTYGFLNLGLMNPNDSSFLASGASSGGDSIATGSPPVLTIASGTSGQTIQLAPSFPNIVINNNNDTVYDSNSISTNTSTTNVITVNGANTTINLGSNNTDTVNLLGGTTSTVSAFAPGTGSQIHLANTTTESLVFIENGASTKVMGSNLTFDGNNVYVVLTASVGTDTTASVLTAMNNAYKVANVANEMVLFLSPDSSGDTQAWLFGSNTGAVNGIIPTATNALGADTAGGAQIVASEIIHIAQISGVLPTALSAADLI